MCQECQGVYPPLAHLIIRTYRGDKVARRQGNNGGGSVVGARGLGVGTQAPGISGQLPAVRTKPSALSFQPDRRPRAHGESAPARLDIIDQNRGRRGGKRAVCWSSADSGGGCARLAADGGDSPRGTEGREGRTKRQRSMLPTDANRGRAGRKAEGGFGGGGRGSAGGRGRHDEGQAGSLIAVRAPEDSLTTMSSPCGPIANWWLALSNSSP